MNKIKKFVIAVITGIAATGCFSGLFSKTTKADVMSVTDKQIDNYLKKASLQQRIGQMYVARTPQELGQAERDAYKYNLGGYIIYDEDLKGYTQNQFKAKIDTYQKNVQVPLLVGIDQEGGLVSRLTHTGFIAQNGDQFKFPREQYQNAEKKEKHTGLAAVTTYAENTASLLHNLGVNWNYAPDADYSDDSTSFIYQRGFGGVVGKNSYDATADYISAVVPAWQHDNLIAATLKHFPGYGDAADTHTGFAHNTKSKRKLFSEDTLPFKAGIEAGVDSVMVTHVIYDNLDSKYPASLSKKINKLLRNKYKFNGVVVTDALEMGAIKDFAKQYGNTSADVLAIKAGNDMIMSADYVKGIPAIAKAVKNGQISQKQINASVKRILQMKNKLHLLTPDDLVVKKLSKKNFSLNNISYNKAKTTATISGKANKNTKINVKNIDTEKIIKKTNVAKNGKFKISIPLNSKSQNLILSAKNYLDVNALIDAKHASIVRAKKFSLNKVIYSKKKTMATISGQLPDKGAEGSTIVKILNSKNKILHTAVVGKDGKFSTNIKVTNKKQYIKVVIGNGKEYTTQKLTIESK